MSGNIFKQFRSKKVKLNSKNYLLTCITNTNNMKQYIQNIKIIIEYYINSPKNWFYRNFKKYDVKNSKFAF